MRPAMTLTGTLKIPIEAVCRNMIIEVKSERMRVSERDNFVRVGLDSFL